MLPHAPATVTPHRADLSVCLVYNKELSAKRKSLLLLSGRVFYHINRNETPWVYLYTPGSLSVPIRDTHLALMELLARAGLLRMVEPLDTNHHIVAPGLPHALDPANIGQVGAAG